MAILGNIRKRTGLTIAVIGFAMVAFLVVDAFSSNSFMFGAADPNNFAEIDGEKVSYNEFQQQQRLLSGRNLPANQANTQAWNQLVRSTLLKKHSQEAGLQMAPFQAEAFQFGLATPEEAEARLAEIKAQAESGNQQAALQYQYWLNSREQINTEAINQQYMTMVNSAALPTSVEAKELAKATSSNVTFEYAFASYQDLETKNKIEVSDDEIKAYVKKFPKKYKREALVNLHYVNFPSEPSAADDSAALNYIRKFTSAQVVNEDSLQAFGSGNTNDSLLVIGNSDEPLNDTYRTFQSLAGNKTLQDFIKTASIGSVTGPYKNAGTYYLSKLLGKKQIDSVNTSHILIGFAEDSIANASDELRTKAEAKVLADSLNAVLQSDPNQFLNLVQQFSEDTGSAQRGGVIGWMTEDSPLVQPYKDFGFNNPKGRIGIAESQFGFHIINITDKTSGTGYKIANLAKKVETSENTVESLFNNANQFYLEVQGKSVNDFANLANEKDYAYQNSDNLERFASQIGYFAADQDDEILSWAFSKDTNAGDVKLFSSTNGGQIVVYLQSRTEEGLAQPASVRKELEPILKRQKMMDLLNEKSADITMDQFVSEYGATKASASSTFANPNVAEKGPEPAVVGAAFGLKQNETSKLIKGNGGVYIIKTLSVVEGSAPENTSAQHEQLENQYQRTFGGQLIPSMIQEADIEDNRSKFFSSNN